MRPADDPVLAAFRAECARQLGPNVGVTVPRALRVYRASLAGAVGPMWATDARRPTVTARDPNCGHICGAEVADALA